MVLVCKLQCQTIICTILTTGIIVSRTHNNQGLYLPIGNCMVQYVLELCGMLRCSKPCRFIAPSTMHQIKNVVLLPPIIISRKINICRLIKLFRFFCIGKGFIRLVIQPFDTSLNLRRFLVFIRYLLQCIRYIF